MKLGTLLLRNAAIGLAQLESALRNQVLYGGRLGTNLVELGFIDLELLSAYLAELSGFPIATPTLLDAVDGGLMDKLGADDAHRLRAIPLGFIGDAMDHVAVAVVEPTNTQVLDELAARLGARITPFVVPELRALYYLEKHFGLPRRARFIRSARPGSEADEGSERRRSQPAQGMVMPPEFTLEPRRKRPSGSLLAASPNPAVTLSCGAACERIDTANHRDGIADALLAYATGRCDALLVFLIRDGNALGWRGYLSNPAAAKASLEDLSLPLAGASSLQSAHDAGQPFVGVPPSAARPVETKLWAALGAVPEPTSVVVVPILVKQRAVNLIYAHTLGGAPDPQLVTELVDLAGRCQTAYLRLIRQARGS
ncbi:MAG: GspIIEN domain protein [Deltaproteobacteria bacterium]|nr:GspIIEN domain protein [Deltaproteobacteria bacterium]